MIFLIPLLTLINGVMILIRCMMRMKTILKIEG